MDFRSTPLQGAYILDLVRIEDERGFFARSFCQHELESNGLNPRIAQCNVSFNKLRGTLRGMHFQIKPHEEAKVVRCTRGAIWDVILDLRPDSSTYHQWYGVELTDESRQALYIPEGFAHGLQTLTDNAEVLYSMSEFYHAESARGVLWNDPAFNIDWPIASPIMSDRDKAYEPVTPAIHANSAHRT